MLYFTLQNCITSAVLLLCLIAGGIPNAVFASIVQNHITDDLQCDQSDYYPNDYPSNTNPLSELCDNLERLREAQVATAVSSM